MSHHILYIPGLGDHYDGLRRAGLKSWSRGDITTELVPMQWYDGGSYGKKKQLIDVAIDRALQAGHNVSLIGESAGASMAVNIMAGRDDLASLTTLCGVVQPTTPIAKYLRRRAPAFDESMKRLADSSKIIEPAATVTFSAYRDSVVRRRYSTIAGAVNITLPSVGHFTTITLALTLLRGRIITSIVQRIE